MGCIQSKPEKGKGLLPQQKEIIRQGNNNKDDSEKVSWSNVARFPNPLATFMGNLTRAMWSLVNNVNSSFSPLLLTKLIGVVDKLNLAKTF